MYQRPKKNHIFLIYLQYIMPHQHYGVSIHVSAIVTTLWVDPVLVVYSPVLPHSPREILRVVEPIGKHQPNFATVCGALLLG